MSSLVGGLVKTHSEMVEKAVQSQKQFLLIASRSKKPDDRTLMDLLKPLSDQIQQIQDVRNKNRTSEFFNHLSAISESIPALGWVTIFPAPGPYVKEMVDASQFYTNKVLVTYKDKDKTHVDWAKSWLAFLTQLQSYIKQHHTTGVSWNQQGNAVGDAAGAQNGVSGPPLPPPPPPPGLFADLAPKDDGRAALLQQLNQGTEITKGLRKVTDEQQTHKNPALRTSGPAPYKPPVASKPVGRVSPPRGPAKLALEGKKWCVEYHKDNQNLVVDQTEMSQSVNVYKCDNVVLQVKGKINSITVDSCKKFSIVFENIVSVVEFINCQQVKAQVWFILKFYLANYYTIIIIAFRH